MPILSKEIKLLTLSLLLRTLPREQQSLLMQHFTQEVMQQLSQIEQATGEDVEKLDWTPFYQSWTELQKILNECKEEIKFQRIIQIAEEQRTKIKEYILIKLGRQKKRTPIFLSEEVKKSVDQFILSLTKM